MSSSPNPTPNPNTQTDSDHVTYIKASCLCTSNTFLIPFITSTLPQSTALCHCSSCRHTSGQLAVHCAVAAGAPVAISESEGASVEIPGSGGGGSDTRSTYVPADLSNLSKYNATPAMTRYFCKTCGAYMLYERHPAPDPDSDVSISQSQSQWMVSTGCLERTEGIVKVGSHTFLADTKDGGLSEFYRTLNGVAIPRYAYAQGEGTGSSDATLPLHWKDPRLVRKQQCQQLEKGGSENHEDRLHLHCHCGNVKLYLTRPDQEEAKKEENLWLVPGEQLEGRKHKPARFIAGHCFCASCRLSTGSLVPSFIILPRANVFNAQSTASQPITLSPTSPTRLHNLTQYTSSPLTYREFCATCGATVFYWTKAAKGPFPRDPGSEEAVVVDLAAGLVDEGDGLTLGDSGEDDGRVMGGEGGGAGGEGRGAGGVLCERWIVWHDLMMNIGEAVDKEGARSVGEGASLAVRGQ
ncbi:hypothetical protein CVT24_011947 [Panaeolus cyanescens]|uniref:CENP-V/GFA domain-containing protein n=1 Tax=Panaeolus cyanescens TaxID=181874 RepID=A0A409W5W0_9AGAR|nr:hypothetical protein CVT24_011947 [Panaeolus cyanescens]